MAGATGVGTVILMAEQFLRPIEDTIIGGYSDAGAGTTDIFESIDEVSPSDVDYVGSREPPINDPYVTRLTAAEAATVNTDHLVRTRVRAAIGSEWGIDYFLELRESYVDEDDKGELIKQWIHALIPTTFTTYEDTLSEAEASNIGEPAELFLRMTFNIAQEPLP
jgi:hypothetical protein